MTGRMPGDLGTADTDGVPYELGYELYRYGNKLIGAATTYALPGRDGPRLSFWVALERQPGKYSFRAKLKRSKQTRIKKGDCGNYVHSIVWEFAVPARLCPYHGQTGSNRITSCSA